MFEPANSILPESLPAPPRASPSNTSPSAAAPKTTPATPPTPPRPPRPPAPSPSSTTLPASPPPTPTSSTPSPVSPSPTPIPDPLAVLSSSDDANARTDRASSRIGPQSMTVSGIHYFNSLAQPFFDIDLAGAGHITVKLNNSTPAPVTAAAGLESEKAVAWLKLLVREEEGSATKGLAEVYRVNTVGGSPAASCKGMPDKFQVDYVAQYWFMGSKN
ncbi:unnamed protein product [Parascedosporium putredinis]|uniref:Uncharacterized protein n=1 Tax=Parascedosporium putredinis TaxID=1442378 RepID=A0A9P1GZ27_9PEZI|nr:unnamed protein product [Parascedosporium putredinis]CAI7991331.1 unnamed protein product [Parascedosporium putredinis]